MAKKHEVRFSNLVGWNMRLIGLAILLFSIPALVHATETKGNSEWSVKDPITVKGKVTAAEDGEPLLGATVAISGTDLGTFTGKDGLFSIEAEPDASLAISYLGYETVIVPIDGRTNIDIVMTLSDLEEDEVVIIGYGTQKKSHFTGATSKVDNKTLDQMPVSRVDDALVGQVSGLNVQATNAEPGAAPTLTLRGFGSVTGSSSPAVVVDGLVVDPEFLGNLDMNTIESFEVLKDAASAAIYGSEGSNGVIIITTKSGEEGKTKFNYETYFGRKEAFGSDGYRKSVADWAARELAATGELSETTQYAQLLVEKTGIDRDWQDVFFDGGFIQSHSLSARGGTKKTSFTTSLRYVHDEGVVITDDYKLYSGDVKMKSRISDRVTFGMKLVPSYSARRRLPTSVHNPIRQSPWLPIYHTDSTLQFVDRNNYPDVGVGDYFFEDHLVNLDLNDDGSSSRPRTSGDSNPYAQYIEREHYEYKTNLLGSTYLQVKIIDGLVAKSSFGTTLEHRKRTRYDGTKYHAAGAGRAAYNLQNRFRTRLISDNTITYTKNISEHEFSALAGATFQRRATENSTISANGYTNDLLKNLQGATTISGWEEINFGTNKIGFFGRINYAYADRFLFNASIRRDASSVFGSDSKWGTFPAVSGGWNLHSEKFLAGNEILSLLKVRASYGLTGSERFNVGDDLINSTAYLSLLGTSNGIINNNVTAGVSPLNLANNGLQWEASREFSPGIDFGFLNNRITGSLDYYIRTSDQLLLNNPVSYVTGFSDGIVNLGQVQNRGFEGELRSRNLVKGKLKWNTTVIVTTNKNELLDFGESNGALLEDSYGRNSQWINQVGSPISSFYGFVADRDVPNEYINTPWLPINGGAEDVIVKDLNGDGLITDEDKTILGDPYPDLIWSITNQFQWGNWDLSFMIQGSQGAEVKNIGDQYFYTWWAGATEDPAQLVTDGVIPHESFLQEKVLTNLVVQPAGYFSLRNVNLGYTFTPGQLQRLHLRSARIYVAGQNLIYNTSDLYNGFNPEFIDDDDPRKYGEQRAGTPLFRTFTVGANLHF